MAVKAEQPLVVARAAKADMAQWVRVRMDFFPAVAALVPTVMRQVVQAQAAAFGLSGGTNMTCCETQIVTLSPVKQGDTFTLGCTYKENGVAVNVTNFTIRAQMRDSTGALILELPVAKANQTTNPGVFVLGANTPPSPQFPIDELQCDIQFSDSENVVRSTQTFFVPVVEDVTHD